ncbi:hypothetical protein PILCRDRAFT_16504 [Piloderma croceum F 1598]|uniref:Uncharacterized protein n=1 Tax=Piloderma croceum (strain F 1598) TaxID=765440 RepID=A0A0C3EW26_PILCF|nr:hypothetical protein PILCRDRAFT_16504 [Piloderma croceum F 1598]
MHMGNPSYDPMDLGQHTQPTSMHHGPNHPWTWVTSMDHLRPSQEPIYQTVPTKNDSPELLDSARGRPPPCKFRFSRRICQRRRLACAFQAFRNVHSKSSEGVFRLRFLGMLASGELPLEVFAVGFQLAAA